MVTSDFRPGLAASLGGVMLGAMCASVGIVRLMFAAVHGAELTVLGGLLFVICTATAFRLAPAGDTNEDCGRYGRHIAGLTFLLLLVGLCNGAAMSTMALEGGLEFSSASLITSLDVDSKASMKAAAAREAAYTKQKLAARTFAQTKVELERTRQTRTEVCTATAGAESAACLAARKQLVALEDQRTRHSNDLDDAKEAFTTCKDECADLRRRCRHALFFLLSAATVMAVFGALFYVVNSVRRKRPGLPGEPNEAPTAASGDESGAPTPRKVAAAAEPEEVEPFDVHAFWGGAFFRVGEAVLFTFCFFWLAWTSPTSRAQVVWLPLLGLFVGMFVRMGEAIVFRLGMRVLKAVETLLPMPAGSDEGAPQKPNQPKPPELRVSRPPPAPPQPLPTPTAPIILVHKQVPPSEPPAAGTPVNGVAREGASEHERESSLP